MNSNSRNAILFALGITIVLCGCSTVPMIRLSTGGHSTAMSPQKTVGQPPPRSHARREIRLQFIKEF